MIPVTRPEAETQHRRVLSEHQEPVFTLRVIKLWDWLAREVVVSLSLEIFKTYFLN